MIADAKMIGRVLMICAASAALALGVACAVDATAVPPTPVPTVAMATPESMPTHIPRQHSADHVPGLAEPVDAEHFVDSYPNHAQTLTQSPARVLVNFDFSLDERSRITVERDGATLDTGAVEFDTRKIYMSAALPPNTGDGLYRVQYRACVAGADCSDGSFGFQVRAADAQRFVDLTAQREVTVHLKNVQYMPANFIIRPGTKVIWVNDDPVPHFVNSDPHPSHNAFPKLNSLDIPLHGTYEFTFDTPGEYTFHCSAHVPQNMFGRILVRADAMTDNATPTQAVALEPTPTQSAATATRAPTNAPTRAPTAIPTRSKTPEPTATLLPQAPALELPPQRFAAHFVASSPEHGAVLERAPEKIQLDFNFTLARNSNLNVVKDDEKLTIGDLEFSENRLQMSANLPDAGAGVYRVLYRACWPDKSCHDGEFAFVVKQDAAR